MIEERNQHNAKLDEAIKAMFEVLNATDYPFRLGEVVSVEGLSCTVKFTQGDDELEIDEILLKSSLNEGEEDGFFQIPEVGSKVWVSLIDEDTHGFVVMTDKVSEIVYKKEGMTIAMDVEKMNATLENMMFELNSNMILMALENSSIALDKDLVDIHSGGKINVSNSSVALKDLWTLTIAAIRTLTVSTGVGPSGTPLPPTIQKLTEIEQKVNQLFQ